MSQSLGHNGGVGGEGAASSGATFGLPEPDAALDEQLAAEIADHLASAADDLVRHGEPQDRAANLALARFGDVESVKRECWWIHQREEIMLRTLGIALIAVLIVGVVVAGYGNWRLQNDLASRSDELSKQLASLAETQQAMLDQQRPPEVNGVAYLGDKSRPAKDVEIQVFRFSDEPPTTTGPLAPGVTVRRLRTDAEGRFESGVLQSGEYCLLAPLQSPDGAMSEDNSLLSIVQSSPLYLTTGAAQATVELNLLAAARVRLESTGLPSSVTVLGEPIDVGIQFRVSTDGVPYFERRPVPPSADPPRDGWPLPLPKLAYTNAGGSKRTDDLPHSWWLPPREYVFELNLSLWSKRKDLRGLTIGQMPVRVPVTVTLSDKQRATISVSLPGESLEDRLSAAVGRLGLKSRETLGFMAGHLSAVLADVVPKIELDVAVTIEEPEIVR